MFLKCVHQDVVNSCLKQSPFNITKTKSINGAIQTPMM